MKVEQKRGMGPDGYYGRKKRSKKQKQKTKEIAAAQRAEKERIATSNNTILTMNQDTSAAYLAGGSKPMTQVDTIQYGNTNAPNMGNFGGAMNVSGVPNKPIDSTTGMPMTYSMMQDEKSAIEKAAQIDAIPGMPANVKAKMKAAINQDKMMRTIKPLPKEVADRSDSTAMFMGGQGPGQYNNPGWKPASDSARRKFPNIDADNIKSSDIYRKGDPLFTITKHIPIVNKRYGTEKASEKGFNSIEIDQKRKK